MQSLYLSTEIIKSLVDLKDSKTLTYVDAMMILCRDSKLAVPVKQTMTKPRSTSFTKRSYDFKLDYRWDAIIIDCPEPGQGTMQLLVGDPIIIDREYLVIPTCSQFFELKLRIEPLDDCQDKSVNFSFTGYVLDTDQRNHYRVSQVMAEDLCYRDGVATRRHKTVFEKSNH